MKVRIEKNMDLEYAIAAALECGKKRNIILNNLKQHALLSGFKLIEKWDEPLTEGMVIYGLLKDGRRLLIVAFKGTDTIYNFFNNFDIRLGIITLINNSNSRKQKAHMGFLKAYKEIQELIHSNVDYYKPDKILVTGHSLGGGLATLCAYDIKKNIVNREYKLSAVSFGSPRVGNRAFVRDYKKTVPNTMRIVNGRDFITLIPRPWMPNFFNGYRHVKKRLRIGTVLFWEIFFSIHDHSLSHYNYFLQKHIKNNYNRINRALRKYNFRRSKKISIAPVSQTFYDETKELKSQMTRLQFKTKVKHVVDTQEVQKLSKGFEKMDNGERIPHKYDMGSKAYKREEE